MTGYSGTPLAKKLGIKAGFDVWTAGAPAGFVDLLAPLPPDVNLMEGDHPDADMAIVFATSRSEIEARFSAAMERISPDGAIWVAWPKRSSGVPTDLTGDTMRELFLPTGMVDNKVCAIDQTWSGLRFVVRKENRAGWNL
ncbi:MAG: DUF3052 domain-containing protein [Acidimicrobiia bacterium]